MGFVPPPLPAPMIDDAGIRAASDATIQALQSRYHAQLTYFDHGYQWRCSFIGRFFYPVKSYPDYPESRGYGYRFLRYTVDRLRKIDAEIERRQIANQREKTHGENCS